jgi:Tol biopolymer transport system component/C-terminal processing protease CtpA/Prc
MHRRIPPRTVAALLAAIILHTTPQILADEVVFARHLALAPDGHTLAFSWAGDIWTVPVTGGHASRLTVHPAHDSRPVWSRDGQRLAFYSTRHGAANVFMMDRDGRNLTRLTFDDRSAAPSDWSLDDQHVYFHSHREGQVFREPMLYLLPTAGGQPWRALDCFAADARLSPDGTHLAFVRGGSNWWRRHYRGSANYDIWLCHLPTGEFSRLTDFDGTDRLPVWDANGQGVYFLSERGGNVNVWYQTIAGNSAHQITHMTEDDVRDLTVSADGRTLAFTHWDGLYVMSLPDGQPARLTVTAGADSPFRDIELRTLRDSADEAEVSPDGKEIALVVQGEIFVIQTAENKPTRRVTDSPWRDWQVTWSPDGKALFFVSDRGGNEQIYRAVSAEEPAKALSASLRFRVEQVTDNAHPSYAPALAPDGRRLAYVRRWGELVIRDLASGDENVLLESWARPQFRWSPDSKWIAYAVEDIEHNSDVWVVPADGSAPAVNISKHPDYDGDPQWSYDGQILTFASRRHGFDTDIYLVFLSPELDELSTVDRDEYFEEQKKAVGKRKPLESAVASGKIRLAGEKLETEPTEPAEGETAETQPAAPTDAEPATTAATDSPARATEPAASEPAAARPLAAQLQSLLEKIRQKPAKPKKPERKKKAEEEQPKHYEYDLKTAYRRIRSVTRLPDDQRHFALAPAGDLVVFVSRHEGDPALFSINWNGRDRSRIQAGGVGGLHWDLTGKRLFYIRGGVPNSCTARGSDAKRHAFSAKFAIDYPARARQKFDDGARAIANGFYDATLKGLDWPTLATKYRDLALQTNTVTEFNEIFNMLLGELNASHMGISGGQRLDEPSERTGYLGCDFDPDYPGPGLKVTAITPRGPATRAESRLTPGDIILSAGGTPVGPDTSLDNALIDSIGEQIILKIIPAPDRDKEPPAASESDGTASTAAPPAADNATTPPAEREIVIRPISYGELAELKYDEWVYDNRAYVEQQTGGRVGYTHIRRMVESSFEVFQRDLYAAAHGKDGLIIDVRSNGGGWTADWILAILSVRRHAYTVPRGATERGYPQDRLIFYAWDKPATMMCDQYSYSNAEIISHAFKNLERGPLVGETTFGAVISTGGYQLIDGTHVRMPFRGWFTLPDGIDMELNGAVPDVRVPVTPADEAAGRRPQLDAAIRATLEQLDSETEPTDTP